MARAAHYALGSGKPSRKPLYDKVIDLDQVQVDLEGTRRGLHSPCHPPVAIGGG